MAVQRKQAQLKANTGAIPAHAGHVLMENRSGPIAQDTVSLASGTAERDSARQLLDRLPPSHVRTLGADRGYGTRDVVAAPHERGIAPRIARDTPPTRTGRHRTSAVPEALARTAGHLASRRIRARIEQSFAWVKEVARLRQTRHRGPARVSAAFPLAVTSCNLARLPKPPGANAWGSPPRNTAARTPPSRPSTRPTAHPAKPIQPRDRSSAGCWSGSRSDGVT
jgi:hypothetical protein